MRANRVEIQEGIFRWESYKHVFYETTVNGIPYCSYGGLDKAEESHCLRMMKIVKKLGWAEHGHCYMKCVYCGKVESNMPFLEDGVTYNTFEVVNRCPCQSKL